MGIWAEVRGPARGGFPFAAMQSHKGWAQRREDPTTQHKARLNQTSSLPEKLHRGQVQEETFSWRLTVNHKIY